jgi:hypothetical protein
MRLKLATLLAAMIAVMSLSAGCSEKPKTPEIPSEFAPLPKEGPVGVGVNAPK